MLDSLTWLIGLIGAILGMAGTIVLCSAGVLVAILVKKLPMGARQMLSAFAATVVAFTLFKELTAHSFYILLCRSFVLIDFSFKFNEIALFMGLFIFTFGESFFRRTRPAVREGFEFNERKEIYRANNKKQSSSLSVLKVSSVLLQ